MNMLFAERAAQAYEQTLDELDRARLAFFMGLWKVMKAGEASAKEQLEYYELPAQEAVRELWFAYKPVLLKYPVALDRKVFLEQFVALRDYVIEANHLAPDHAKALKALNVEGKFTEELVELAGRNPQEFVSELVAKLLKDQLEPVAYMAGLLAMQALRVQLEPIAAELEKMLPNGELVNHHPTACPVCGSLPSLSRIGGVESPTEGRGKSLHCEQCGTTWDFERIRCARCGETDPEKLHTFNIEGDDAHRIATCDTCGGYIRTVYLEDSLAPFSFEVEEVVTAKLDAIARDQAAQAQTTKAGKEA